MIGSIVFNSIGSVNYGVYVTDPHTEDAPARIYTTEHVPGRNGDLAYDTGAYENMSLSYPAFIYDDFEDNVQTWRNLMASQIGYKRLEDTLHPDEYRLARYISTLTVSKTVYNDKGRFNIDFDCKPQRFLKSGETTVVFTEDSSISNPTAFDAKPLIRIYGAGTVGIGTVNITFDGSTPYVDLDCELQDAYYGGTNKNSSITLSPNEFPVLHSGANGITLGSGITSVEITPNWWRL